MKSEPANLKPSALARWKELGPIDLKELMKNSSEKMLWATETKYWIKVSKNSQSNNICILQSNWKKKKDLKDENDLSFSCILVKFVE